MVSGRLGAMSRMKVLLHQARIALKGSITEVFYHLNNMLIATKRITDNNFVFQ